MNKFVAIFFITIVCVSDATPLLKQYLNKDSYRKLKAGKNYKGGAGEDSRFVTLTTGATNLKSNLIRAGRKLTHSAGSSQAHVDGMIEGTGEIARSCVALDKALQRGYAQDTDHDIFFHDGLKAWVEAWYAVNNDYPSADFCPGKLKAVENAGVNNALLDVCVGLSDLADVGDGTLNSNYCPSFFTPECARASAGATDGESHRDYCVSSVTTTFCKRAEGNDGYEDVVSLATQSACENVGTWTQPHCSDGSTKTQAECAATCPDFDTDTASACHVRRGGFDVNDGICDDPIREAEGNGAVSGIAQEGEACSDKCDCGDSANGWVSTSLNGNNQNNPVGTWVAGSCDSTESGRSENQANCEQTAGTFVTIYAAENPTACLANKLSCVSRPRQCDTASSAYVDKYSFFSQNLISNDDFEENIDLYSHSGSTSGSKILGGCPTDIGIVQGRGDSRSAATCTNSDGSACVNTCPIDDSQSCPGNVKEAPVAPAAATGCADAASDAAHACHLVGGTAMGPGADVNDGYCDDPEAIGQTTVAKGGISGWAESIIAETATYTGTTCQDLCDCGNADNNWTPTAASHNGIQDYVPAVTAVGDNVYSISNAGVKIVEDVNDIAGGSCQRYIGYNAASLCAAANGDDMTLTLSMPNGAKYCDGQSESEFTACKRERKLLQDFVWKLPCNELSEQMSTSSGDDDAGYEDYLNFQVDFALTAQQLVSDISSTKTISSFTCGSLTTGVCKPIDDLCAGLSGTTAYASLSAAEKDTYISRLREIEISVASLAEGADNAAAAYALYGSASNGVGLGSLQCSALLSEINEDLAATLFDGEATVVSGVTTYSGGCRGLQQTVDAYKTAFATTVGHLHQLARKRQRMENRRLLMTAMTTKINTECTAHFTRNQRTKITLATAGNVKSDASSSGPGLKRAFEMAATTQQDNVISIERKRVENVLTNIDDQLNYLKDVQDAATGLIANEVVAKTKSINALKLILVKIGDELVSACPAISAEIKELATSGNFVSGTGDSEVFTQYLDSSGYYVNPLYAILTPAVASTASTAAGKVQGIRNSLENLVDAAVEYCYAENGKIFDNCEQCATQKILARDDELATIVEPLLTIKSGLESVRDTAKAASCAAVGASTAARVEACSVDDKVIDSLSFSIISSYLTSQQIVGYEGESSLSGLITDLEKCTAPITTTDTRSCPSDTSGEYDAWAATQEQAVTNTLSEYGGKKTQCLQALDRLLVETESVDSTSGELMIFAGQCTGTNAGEPACGPHTPETCAGCADITPVIGPTGSTNFRCGPGIYQKVLAYANAERAAYTATQAYNAEAAKGGMSVKAVKDRQDDVSSAEEFVEIIHKHIHALKDEKVAYEGRADLLFQKCEALVDKKIDAIIKHAIKTEVLNREWEVTAAYKNNLNEYVDNDVKSAAQDYCDTVESVRSAASSLSITTADYVTPRSYVDCSTDATNAQCARAAAIIGTSSAPGYTVNSGDTSDTIYNANFAGDFADNSDGHCLPASTGGGGSTGGDGGTGGGGGGVTVQLCADSSISCGYAADGHKLEPVTGASCASDPCVSSEFSVAGGSVTASTCCQEIAGWIGDTHGGASSTHAHTHHQDPYDTANWNVHFHADGSHTHDPHYHSRRLLAKGQQYLRHGYNLRHSADANGAGVSGSGALAGCAAGNNVNDVDEFCPFTDCSFSDTAYEAPSTVYGGSSRSDIDALALCASGYDAADGVSVSDFQSDKISDYGLKPGASGGNFHLSHQHSRLARSRGRHLSRAHLRTPTGGHNTHGNWGYRHNVDRHAGGNINYHQTQIHSGDEDHDHHRCASGTDIDGTTGKEFIRCIEEVAQLGITTGSMCGASDTDCVCAIWTDSGSDAVYDGAGNVVTAAVAPVTRGGLYSLQYDTTGSGAEPDSFVCLGSSPTNHDHAAVCDAANCANCASQTACEGVTGCAFDSGSSSCSAASGGGGSGGGGGSTTDCRDDGVEKDTQALIEAEFLDCTLASGNTGSYDGGAAFQTFNPCTPKSNEVDAQKVSEKACICSSVKTDTQTKIQEAAVSAKIDAQIAGLEALIADDGAGNVGSAVQAIIDAKLALTNLLTSDSSDASALATAETEKNNKVAAATTARNGALQYAHGSFLDYFAFTNRHVSGDSAYQIDNGFIEDVFSEASYDTNDSESDNAPASELQELHRIYSACRNAVAQSSGLTSLRSLVIADKATVEGKTAVNDNAGNAISSSTPSQFCASAGQAEFDAKAAYDDTLVKLTTVENRLASVGYVDKSSIEKVHKKYECCASNGIGTDKGYDYTNGLTETALYCDVDADCGSGAPLGAHCVGGFCLPEPCECASGEGGYDSGASDACTTTVTPDLNVKYYDTNADSSLTYDEVFDDCDVVKPLTAAHLGNYYSLAAGLEALLPAGLSDFTCSQLGAMLAGAGTSPWASASGLNAYSCAGTVGGANAPTATAEQILAGASMGGFGGYCSAVEGAAGAGSFGGLLKQVVSTCYASCQNWDCGTITNAVNPLTGAVVDLRCELKTCDGDNTLVAVDGGTCTVGGSLGDALNAASAGSATLDCAGVAALTASDRNDVCKSLVQCASGDLVPPRDCAVCVTEFGLASDFPSAYSCNKETCTTAADGNVCQNGGVVNGEYADPSNLSGCGCTCAAGFYGDNCELAGGCTNMAGWVDTYNDGCDYYEDLKTTNWEWNPSTQASVANGVTYWTNEEIGDECSSYADEFGVSACSACCVCGGGANTGGYDSYTNGASAVAASGLDTPVSGGEFCHLGPRDADGNVNEDLDEDGDIDSDDIWVSLTPSDNQPSRRRRLLSNWAKQKRPLGKAFIPESKMAAPRTLKKQRSALRKSYNAYGGLKLGRPDSRTSAYYDTAAAPTDGSASGAANIFDYGTSDESYNLEYELCHATQHVNINAALNAVIEPVLGTNGFNAALEFAAESGNSGADSYVAGDASSSQSFSSMLLQSALELSNNQIAVYSRTSAACTSGDLAIVHGLAARYSHIAKCVAPEFEQVIENARNGNVFQCSKILQLNGALSGKSLSELTPNKVNTEFTDANQNSVLFAFEGAVEYFRTPGTSSATHNRVDALCGSGTVPNKRSDAPTASEITGRSGNSASFPLSTKCVSEFNNALYDIAKYLDASQTTLVKVDYSGGFPTGANTAASDLPEYAQVGYSSTFANTHINNRVTSQGFEADIKTNFNNLKEQLGVEYVGTASSAPVCSGSGQGPDCSDTTVEGSIHACWELYETAAGYKDEDVWIEHTTILDQIKAEVVAESTAIFNKIAAKEASCLQSCDVPVSQQWDALANKCGPSQNLSPRMSCKLVTKIDGSDTATALDGGLNVGTYNCLVDEASEVNVGDAAALHGTPCVPDISGFDSEFESVDGSTVNSDHGSAGTYVVNAIAQPRTNAVVAVKAAIIKLHNQLSGGASLADSGYLWLSGYSDITDVCEKINREEEEEHLQELSLANDDAADNFFGNFMGDDAASSDQYVPGYDYTETDADGDGYVDGMVDSDDIDGDGSNAAIGTENQAIAPLGGARRLRKEPCTLCD